MRDLRDFRLFFTETFTGNEDPEYIKDKLLSLHEQQLETSRKWGFATVIKSLSAVMDQNTMISTAAAAVPLAIAGGPAAVAGGLLVPIGRLTLELAKVKAEADEKLSASPVRYLSRVAKLD